MAENQELGSSWIRLAGCLLLAGFRNVVSSYIKYPARKLPTRAPLCLIAAHSQTSGKRQKRPACSVKLSGLGGNVTLSR
jgi:hypothetical protein